MFNTRFPAFAAVLLWGGPLLAQPSQNSDMAILAGAMPSSSQILTGTSLRISSETNTGFLMSFGHQLEQTRAGVLWWEFSTVFLGASSVEIGSGVSASNRTSSLLMPGVRFQVSPHPRFQFYGLAGGGWGMLWKSTSTVGSSGVKAGWDAGGQLVGEVGGGMDFRLTRMLSLRAELRDFITAKGQLGRDGRNHPLLMGGIAFHF